MPTRTTEMNEFEDEADLAVYIHDKAMSDNHCTACFGRIMKELMPTLIKSLKQEQQRGTQPSILLEIAPEITMNILFSIIAPVGTDEPEALMQALRIEVIRALDESSERYSLLRFDHQLGEAD